MKRIRLYFSQTRYDPNSRVITHIVKYRSTVDFIRNNVTNSIVMESVHTGKKRLFTYVTHGKMAIEERYVYINKRLNVQLHVIIQP